MEENRCFPRRREFQTLAFRSCHLQHKMSPCLYLQMWPFPSCDPITRSGAQQAPCTLQSCSEGSQQHSTVSQTNRKKESQYGRATGWLLKQGLVWKKDNGLVISHINISKMPIASRQPFTSAICEECQRLGKARRQETPSWNGKYSKLYWRKESLIFWVPDRALLIYNRTFQADDSNLKLLQLPPLLVANDEVEDSAREWIELWGPALARNQVAWYSRRWRLTLWGRVNFMGENKMANA